MRIIAGMARGRTFDAPQGLDTRPTLDRVRENVFNILQMKARGAAVLDLFSGSGAMAFEALSRGAESAVLVDCDRQAHQVQQRNAVKLRMDEQCRILHCDWQDALRRLAQEGARFNLVFLDPPYKMVDLTAVFAALKAVLAEDAVILLEHDAKGFPAVTDGYFLYDSRKYGAAGVSFLRQAEVE